MRSSGRRYIAAGPVCTVVLAGCASSVAIRAAKAGSEIGCIVLPADGDVLVGVALSGSGSRVALFGAAGLETLARVRALGGASLLEQVSDLSSVSGGSVAATYYATKKPGRQTRVLGADAASTDEYRAFFDRYKEDLTQNFEGALIRRQPHHRRRQGR
jgi:hypothetical protein